MNAGEWQETLERVRSLSTANKDRLLTFLHALHDAAQHSSNAEGTPNTLKVL